MTQLLQKEKRLLAHLFAGIADVLDAPGAIDAIASLSKKIADVICERNLQMETSMSLLSLLEKLSAWSVAIIKTNVLKGSLELKAIEMKVGKIPNFIDPYKVIDEMMEHSNWVRDQSVILPLSPPDSPGVGTNLKTLDAVEAVTTPTLDSPLTMSFSESLGTISTSSIDSISGSGRVVEGESAEIAKYSIKIPASPVHLPDDDCSQFRVDISPHKLPLVTGKVQTEVQNVACSFNANANVTITEDTGAITIQGSSKKCKQALIQIEKILDGLSCQEGTRYVLPDWMSYDHYAERIQGIAKGEGCTVEELTDSRNNRSYIFIQSERGWNIRRCVETLQEFEKMSHPTIPTSSISRCDSNRIDYDRSRLLMVRDTLTTIDEESQVLKQLKGKAQTFGLLAQENTH